MNTLYQTLQEARIKKNWVVRELAAQTRIDAALISKFEKGHRIPSEDQLQSIATALELSLEQLKKQRAVERVLYVLKDEEYPEDILMVAESRVEYLNSKKVFELEPLSSSIKEKLNRIEQLKKQWQAQRPLNGIQLEKMREHFSIEYTYESNRIEGNTLSLQETHLVINEGLTIGGKSMREHLEAVNHAEAIDFMEELAIKNEHFNKRSLQELHYLILKGIDRDHAGRYRKVPVRISGSAHVPPQPFLIDKMMEDYFIHYQNQKLVMHPVLLAAEMHERLVSIHPFIDGNGRTSRLVMNFILLMNGYTIANLKGDNTSRLRYYKALEEVQIDANPEPFYHLVADAVEESLNNHLELI